MRNPVFVAFAFLAFLAFLASLTGLAGRGHAQSAPPSAPDLINNGLGDEGLGVTLRVQSTFQRLAERCARSVVTVTAHVKADAIVPQGAPTTNAGEWMREASADDLPGCRPLRSCSGFVVSDAGDILTCRSFLLKPDGEFADVVTAETKDGRTTICSVIASEPTLDLALLRFEVYPEGCPPLFVVGRIGDSTRLRPGQLALAMGDPHGPEVFLASGLVSSLPSRECYQDMKSATYLQTTMVVHPEAYGGPLLNLDGEIVGMLVPRMTPADTLAPYRTFGLEFALPSNIMNTIYQVLVTKKSMTSPWLGIAIMSRAELRKERGPETFEQMRKPGFGVFIENTFTPSPASEAGIQSGDFLVKIDGRPVMDPMTFQRALYLAGIGAELKLELFRDGETCERTLRVAQRPAEALTR